MADDIREMVWESEQNSTFKAPCKDPAQDSSCTYAIQFTTFLHKPLERPVMTSLPKSNFYKEMSKTGKPMTVDTTMFTPSFDIVKAKQNGNGRSSIFPAQISVNQKPRAVRCIHPDAKTMSGPSNSVFPKTNSGLSSAFEKSFPIKSAAGSSSRSGTCRRSPKKVQRRYLSTVEETVREEEKEIYRQLLQVVTGKTYLSTTSIFPPETSRCLSSSNSISEQPGASSLSSLEPYSLDLETSYKPSLSFIQPSTHVLEPLFNNTSEIKLNSEARIPINKQLCKEQNHTSPSQSEGSSSDLVLEDAVPKEPKSTSQSIFQALLWIKEISSTYDSRARERSRQIEKEKARALQLQKERLRDHSVQESVDLHLRVPLEKEIPVTLLPKKEIQEEENEFPELTEEMDREIKRAFFGGSQDQTLSEAFRLAITRKDIMTLNNLNWLNDEVIDFRKKSITYYDSMGGLNNEACRILLHYLKQESLDKKGVCFDTNDWTLSCKNNQEIPQQMNGSDCGMFACKYADYITKDKPITFTQRHMPYFRKKMVWEILHQKLL